jgi:HPt (histidine-containing phosphotransfer) domain-containing protein
MLYPTDPAGPAIKSCTNVFDVSVFQELVESLQTEAAAAVYRKFLENAASFIDGLPQQNTDARVETFHTLKGSAAMMGANRMSELAAQLETQGAAVQVESATQLLKEELEKFRAAVASRLLESGVSLDTPQ